jgi:hypothetical protein
MNKKHLQREAATHYQQPHLEVLPALPILADESKL